MKAKTSGTANKAVAIPRARKPYRPPRIVEYGTIAELTRGAAGTKLDIPGSRKDL